MRAFFDRFGLTQATLVDGLLDVADTLAREPDYNARFTSLCRTAQRVLGCDRSSLFLRDGNLFRGRYNVGNPPDIARTFPAFFTTLNDPLLAEAVRLHSYVIVNDAVNDPRMNATVAREARIRALVLAPLFDQDGAPVGFMTAEYNQNRGRFGHLHSKVLLGLAKLAETVVQSQKNAQQHARMAEQLHAGARLEALSRLSSGIAHDLNNRLTVILGVADLLRSRYADADINALQLAAEAAAELNRRLLQFARGTPQTADSTLDVSAALTELEYTLRRFVTDRGELRLDVQADCHVRMSRSQFEQIVTNLVINARDASEDGGVICVSLRSADSTAAAASNPAATPLPGTPEIQVGQWAVLTVTDQGEGISPEHLNHVFEPFFTTKENGHGTGLGLASVHGIVGALGGHIGVVSTPGRGSTFTVRLARVPGQPAHATPAAAPRQLGARPLTILLVDDDEPVRNFTAMALKRAGHEVLEAAGSLQALELAFARRDLLDVLVSDMVMPEINGFELATSLRHRNPVLPVLFVSAYFPEELRRDLPGRGPSGFLPKPFAPEELAHKVAELVGTTTGARQRG